MNTKKSQPLFLLVMMLLGFSFPLSANDGAYIQSAVPGTFIPVSNDLIEMVSEEIMINVDYDDASGYGGLIFVNRYDCLFTFRKTTGNPVKLNMGFPFQQKKYEGTPEKDSIGDFTVEVDGVNVGFSPRKHGKSEELPGIVYDEVFVFQVEFKAHEEKRIRNRFWIRDKGSFQAGPLRMGPYHVDYILKSGGTWTRPIKQADVRIRFDFPAAFLKPMKITPAQYGKNEGEPYTVSFHYENFKPENDIHIEYDTRLIEDYNSSVLTELLTGFIRNKECRWLGIFANSIAASLGSTDRKLDEILRKAFYWAAYYFYRKKDYYYASGYYEMSLGFELKKQPAAWDPGFGNDNGLKMEIEKVISGGWRDEDEKNEPGYYCAYNIACCHSLMAADHDDEYKEHRLKDAMAWLTIAMKMNKKRILPLIKGDPDLALLRKENPAGLLTLTQE